MTAGEFRKLAVSFPGTGEQRHMQHPDFRVAGEIFAMLAYPDKNWGMVKLTPQQQAGFVQAHPKIFQPFDGAWGRRGCTKVILKAATKTAVTPALVAAWRNSAPTGLSRELASE